MKIKRIIHKSSQYWDLVSLRDNILRKPLGLKFTEEELLNENNQLHFAVFQQNTIVAGLILVKINSELIKMRQVCVSESEQGKGIGKKLVLHTENWAKENKYETIYCHARQNALDFYTKLDYKIVGDSFEEVGLEHFKLVKKF